MSATAEIGVVRGSIPYRLPRLTAFVWRHPEWWSLALCAGAWVLMIRRHSAHAGHSAHDMAGDLSGEMVSWLHMTLAMMLPMVAGSVRATAERSLWSRRNRAMAGFLLGYTGSWLIVGLLVGLIVILGVALLRLPPTAGRWSAGIALGIAGAWQLTRAKRLALASCHRTAPLAPQGWRADRDCVLFGWTIGKGCIVSCWALMLACFMAGHSLPATAGLTAIGVVERYATSPGPRVLSGALFAVALLYFL